MTTAVHSQVPLTPDSKDIRMAPHKTGSGELARTLSCPERSDQDEIREFLAAKNSPEGCGDSDEEKAGSFRRAVSGRMSPTLLRSFSSKSCSSVSGASTRAATSSSSLKNVFSSFRNSFKSHMRKALDASESTILRASAFELDEHDLKVKDKLGEGSTCDVFSGELKPSSRKVAIKKLRGNYNTDTPLEQKNALLTELEVLSVDMSHPHIVQFIGVSLYHDANVLVLVFELLGGGNLENYFESRSTPTKAHQVPFTQALQWSLQLFEALTFLHGKSPPIIHRDLKPVNLMLSADHKVIKLRDFGLSKTIDRGSVILPARGKQHEIKTDATKIRQTTGHRFTGTARYMAPECNRGATDYSDKADVYSSALIMWFMLEGERPWERHHGQIAFSLAKSGHRPALSAHKYPQTLAHLIARCWAPDPEARPSAADALRELQRMDDVIGKSAGCWLTLPGKK